MVQEVEGRMAVNRDTYFLCTSVMFEFTTQSGSFKMSYT